MLREGGRRSDEDKIQKRGKLKKEELLERVVVVL